MTPSLIRQPPGPGRRPYGLVRLSAPPLPDPATPTRPTATDTRWWDGRRISLPPLSIGALRQER